jgi:hypothetical protein
MWNLPQLTPSTRELMLNEFQFDVMTGTPYLGKHLSELGKSRYADLARQAFRSGTPETFAQSLEPVPGPMWQQRYQRKDGVWAKVSSDAATRLASGEFNRYYMRAICFQAVHNGTGMVEVFRAKDVENVRSEGPKSGDKLNAANVLLDLKQDYDQKPASGMPHGPNSGLSLRFELSRADG